MNREKEKFADYDAIKTRNVELENEVGTLKSTIEETNTAKKSHEQTVADLNKKIAEYETASLRTRIALQNGLPIDLADRLVGDDEESIKADAERLSSFVSKTMSAPLKNVEPNIQKDENSAYRKLVEGLQTEGE